jgi:hypothetical protein
MKMRIPEGYSNLHYYGRGPHENYADRKSGAVLDLYTSTVEQQYVPYGEPQENGSKQDVQWLSLISATGAGIMIVAEGKPFGFSALPYTIKSLEQARHLNELDPVGYTTLCVDARQRGVGNGVDTPRRDAGGFLMKAYAVDPEPAIFSFSIRPIAGINGNYMEKSRIHLRALSKPFISRDEMGSVSMSCSSPGAEIRFTTDGSDPGRDSKLYTAPFLWTNESLIKAVAIREGLEPSEIQARKLAKMQVKDPVLSPAPGRFFRTQEIVAGSETAGVEIYYTTDGSEPGEHSKRLTAGITISDDTNLKIKAFKPGYRPSETVEGKYVKYERKKPGVYYRYFVGEWRIVPDVDRLVPEREGFTDQFSFENIDNNRTHFALQMFGVISIEQEGQYIFTTGSNDGSLLFVNGIQVVDNNGDHGYKEESGEVYLKAGEHLVEVRYYQIGGGQDLVVFYEGPGIEKMVVPTGVLR